MKDVFRKSWLRKCDQSPSKSISPTRSQRGKGSELSPIKFFDNLDSFNSPFKKTQKMKNGKIISPERNPHRNNNENKKDISCNRKLFEQSS